MNAPTLSDLRSAATRDLADEKMDQVRDLLVGDIVRRLETRIAHLEARLADIELGISRQIDAVEARIDTLAGASDADRRASFEALGRSVADLSEQIRRIGRS